MGPDLRAAFAEAVEKERRDVRVAAVTLVLISIAGTILLAVLLAHESAKGGRPYAWLASGWLAFVFGAFLLSNDTERADRPWVVAAGLILAPLFLLGLLTALPQKMPGLFWTLFAAGSLGGFGCLGMAYRWRDPYFGIWWGPDLYDDPTTLRDDRDRAHHGLTAFVALPRMIVGGFADLAGRGWMRAPLDGRDVEAAVELLSRLAVHDRQDLGNLLRPRALLWMSKMGLIRRGETGWALTTEGEKLAGTHSVL